jgi:hypothetical protein
MKFWEELIAYFPLVRHRSHRKRRLQHFLRCRVSIRCCGNVFTEPRIYIYIYIYIKTHSLSLSL